jgi:2,4-dienoyl-CoA reductase-like NADH-dependent reductase (Old Yellow Enzyme family)
MTKIWTPINVGSLQLPHRLAMAPMTRSRAKPDGTPGDLAPTYYAQRASMGLLITEGTQPPKMAKVIWRRPASIPTRMWPAGAR